MKFFVHDFSTWTYCSFSSKRNLHWKYLFEKGKTKTFLSRHILSLAPYLPVTALALSARGLDKYSHNNVQPTSLKSRTLYVKLFSRNEKIISWKYYWLSSYVTSCWSSTLPSRRTTRDEARRETKVPLTWEAIRML